MLAIETVDRMLNESIDALHKIPNGLAGFGAYTGTTIRIELLKEVRAELIKAGIREYEEHR